MCAAWGAYVLGQAFVRPGTEAGQLRLTGERAYPEMPAGSPSYSG
jgi:hypothetical protein